MRARYYSPELRIFINADIIAGEISNAITLNRYAYANGNPVSFVDPFGLSAEDRGKIDRKQYIDNFMKNTDNILYNLLKSWKISLTESFADEVEYIDMFWGGFTVKISADISFETPIDANVSTDVSLNKSSSIHETTTPELKIPWADISTKIGVYTDGDRLSIGVSNYVSKDGWTFGTKHQVGLYSEASIITVSYKPEDEYLPTVSVTLDTEINHLVKVVAAAAVVVAVYAPEAIIAAAPTLTEFVQQLGNMTPQFSH